MADVRSDSNCVRCAYFWPASSKFNCSLLSQLAFHHRWGVGVVEIQHGWVLERNWLEHFWGSGYSSWHENYRLDRRKRTRWGGEGARALFLSPIGRRLQGELFFSSNKRKKAHLILQNNRELAKINFNWRKWPVILPLGHSSKIYTRDLLR